VHLALTRPVPASIARCELTHLERQPIDYERAARQHEQYEEVLRSLGCRVMRLPAEDAYPDSVFIEDTAVVFDDCAIIARPGAESRRGEIPGVVDTLAEHRLLYPIEAPGTLDGGDVLRVGHRVYVGQSSRTNEEGARQMIRILQPLGYVVTAVPVREALHLKTAVSDLGDGRVLINPRMVDGANFRDVACFSVDPAEPMAANVLFLQGKVLCAASAPRTRRIMEREGIDVIPVDSSELAKAEGGLTCCSLILDTRRS
jgi:dimethylargininase